MQVTFDDDTSTTTIDVARIWLRTGDGPNDLMSIAVMVRAVSRDNPIHVGVQAYLCEKIRKAVEDAMGVDQVLLWVRKLEAEGAEPNA